MGNVFNRYKFLVIYWYLRFSMATVTVHCPRCNSDEVYRHGRIVPGMSVSVVAHVNVFSSSLTLMKLENPALRS
ncbi:hypothetical protein EZK75_25220, partial [Salmonella enterica subsp. enterica serovar Schwarzengrund]|nr:hypothetical protein [Salmonella enterica subsp. enterica serovar Schwarzengrund]